MGSIGSGFRVLQPRDRGLFADPKIVAFQLDPATLDFVKLSGSTEPMLGFSLEEWCRPGFWHGRLHPEDAEAVRAFFAVWPETGPDQQLEYRVVDAAGQTVWVHQIIVPRGEASRETAVRGVLMDITERVIREAEVTKALMLKDELFRILAEELAPPLRAISVHGEMLERHLAAQQDDVGSDHALGLRDGVQRLDGLFVQLMRAAQDNMSIDEMGAFLAALRGPRRAG